MKLVYLSTDELNRSLVRGWGVRRGVRVECPCVLDRAAAGPSDVVLLDLDHLPSGRLAGLMARLEVAVVCHRVAAHGYMADEAEWRRQGVEMSPRLRPELLKELASAIRLPDPVPTDRASDELTWVNLV